MKVNQPNKELIDLVGQEIRKSMENHLGKNSTLEQCLVIKNSINDCLHKLCFVGKIVPLRFPEIKVENDGPFVTVNFFDKEGKRLETLEDMLTYMEKMI